MAPVALFGLTMVWLVGWKRGRQLYQGFYDEERARLQHAVEKEEKRAKVLMEETLEEKVQEALRERLLVSSSTG